MWQNRIFPAVQNCLVDFEIKLFHIYEKFIAVLWVVLIHSKISLNIHVHVVVLYIKSYAVVSVTMSQFGGHISTDTCSYN